MFDDTLRNAKLVILIHHVDAPANRFPGTDIFVILGAELLSLGVILDHIFSSHV